MGSDHTHTDLTPLDEATSLRGALEGAESRLASLEPELRRVTAELSEARAALGKMSGELTEKSAALTRYMDMLSGDPKAASGALLELLEDLHQKEQHIQRDTELAKQVAERLLPMFLPAVEGVEIAARYDPTERVGADLYDVIDMGHRCVGILVADASGFGLQAALLAAMAKMAFKTFTANELSPLRTMSKVNADLCEHTLDGQFLTAFFGVLDCSSLRLTYVNASHCAPVLLRNGELQLLDTEGLFLGMFEEPQYEEKQLQLRVSDTLVFYTDGVTQAMGEEGQLYRHQRLYDFLRSHSEAEVEDLADQLFVDLRMHTGGVASVDDATLLALEVMKRPAGEQVITIPSDPAEIPHVDAAIASELAAVGFGERTVFGVKLAIEEAVINAIKHGNHNDKGKVVRITFSVNDDRAVIRVTDAGVGFSPDEVPDPTADENMEHDHGRGIFLMRAYMDEVSFNEKGNEVVMVKRAPWVSGS